MAKWKIVFDKELCIGNGICAKLHPEGWAVPNSPANGGDGKSHIIGGIKRSDGWEEKDVADITKHMEAAQGCPVNAIHIIDEETGEQII